MEKKQEPVTIKDLTGDVAEMGRDLWLAGLGAIAAVEEESTKMYENVLDTSSKRLKKLQEEATALFEDLVKRGEAFEQKGRKQITAQVEAVKEEVESVKEDFFTRQHEFTDKIEETVAGSVEKTLEKLEVPTRTEVRTLTKQVERLTEQVKKLAAGLEA